MVAHTLLDKGIVKKMLIMVMFTTDERMAPACDLLVLGWNVEVGGMNESRSQRMTSFPRRDATKRGCHPVNPHQDDMIITSDRTEPIIILR